MPGLAESYEDEDLTVWKFKLRKDVKFQSGEPVTAEDIIHSIEYAAEIYYG
jgi:ABC-type transport system substrate-binding protein